jgi:major vault protein
LSGI